MFMRRLNGFPLAGLRNDFDQVVGDLFDTVAGAVPFGTGRSRAFPAVNIWEDDKNLFAEAEVPGLTMDDIEVLVHRNELTIRGTRREPEAQDTTYHRRERGLGEFSRIIQLPFEVDSENVQATMRDGVLLITMPKSPAALPRKIKVSS